MFKAEFAKYNRRMPFLEFLQSLSKDEQVDVTSAIDNLLLINC